MKVDLHNQTNEKINPYKRLIKKIFKPIDEEKNMQIIFVNQESIKQMNQAYRNIDRPTDVLSFINDDPLDQSIGDIFISLEQARIQATELEHSIEREVGFLAVHGYLHLKGYDHHTKEDEKIMILEQEKILSAAKLERK